MNSAYKDRMQFARLFLCALPLGTLLLASGGCTPESPSTGEDDGGRGGDAGPQPVDTGPPLACGDALPGPGPVVTSDGAPGYFEEVEALDLEGIDDVVDLGELSVSQRALVNFMLLRPGGDVVTGADIDAAGRLGHAVAAAIAKGGGSEIDFSFLRRSLYHLYACSRPLPPTLDDLRARFGDYTTWDERTVSCSRAKNAPRRLRTRPDGEVFIAETLDEDGGVRETEVLFRTLRDDGHLDFAAYTAAGELTNRSTFATPASEVVLSSPAHCLSCHLDSVSETMSLVDATGSGSGSECP